MHANVVRMTASGVVNSGKQYISAVQTVGGTTNSALYDGTSAVAANKVIELKPDTIIRFPYPVRVNDLYLQKGDSTEVFIHIV